MGENIAVSEQSPPPTCEPVIAKALFYPPNDSPPLARQVQIAFSRSENLLGVGSFGLVFEATIKNVSFSETKKSASNPLDNKLTRCLQKPEKERKQYISLSYQTRFALKIMSVKRRENKELAILKKLNHPHLVKLHYFNYSTHEALDEDENIISELCLNLFFELLPTTLFEELHRIGHFSESKTLYYLRQIVLALQFLHKRDICHRDLKPSNLLMDPERKLLKLCDFGSAKVISANSGPNVSYICSRFYRAPELLLGSEQYGSSVDIWSLGCLVAEMISGQILFYGEEEPMDQLLEILCVLGPISEAELREMHSVLPVLDDNWLPPRLVQAAGPERLAALIRLRATHEPSEELVDLIGDMLQYIPYMRPLTTSILDLFS